MIDTLSFGTEMKRHGFDLFCGVPCSFLKDLINYASNRCDYVAANNEGDAVAIAAGAHLGGKKAVVLMQNSGLTNAISPLTSLNAIFKIPVLGFVSLRGEPGLADEPQHELMGGITAEFLDLMKIEWETLSGDAETALEQLCKANQTIEKGDSFFFLVKKGTFSPVQLEPRPPTLKPNERLIRGEPGVFLRRREVLEALNGQKDGDSVHIATTGHTGRELYEVEDAAQNFYMVGSMGCASPFGLGVALARPDKKVIVLDGDGALLMRLGNLAANGAYGPPNLLHILLDNHSYESTGEQSTIAHNVDFAGLAASCGYRRVASIASLDDLNEELDTWRQDQKLTFLWIKTEISRAKLGRPKVSPIQVKERLMEFIKGSGKATSP